MQEYNTQSNQAQIKCPNCGTSIDVQDILAHQLEEEIKQKYQSQLANEQKKVAEQEQKLKNEKEDFELKKKQENGWRKNGYLDTETTQALTPCLESQ